MIKPYCSNFWIITATVSDCVRTSRSFTVYSNFQTLLEECSSPPHLRVSPSFSKNVQHLAEGQTGEKRDEEKEKDNIRTIVPREILSSEKSSIRYLYVNLSPFPWQSFLWIYQIEEVPPADLNIYWFDKWWWFSHKQCPFWACTSE